MEMLYFLEKIRMPGLNEFMLLITHFGEETAFLVAALIVFWCVDKQKGYYVMTVGFIGTMVNQFLKLACRVPRPWVLDPDFTILEQAREALSLKYMGTVQQRFISYMNRISGEDHERIYVTPELEVTIERLGEPRPLDYFSAGQTDIVTLCMRLALVDALFEDTHPFVILDDPFVNLDDRNMKQALDILRELSEDHQILYLVCNSSRTL
jgi:hypothetical protein